ncbi:MAG: C45 family autoproteolytic acyltransferase/hydrolase [bacterium]
MRPKPNNDAGKMKHKGAVILGAFLMGMICGCVGVPRNELPLYQRSMIIENKAMEDRILAKASLVETADPNVNNIRILSVSGTPYEMGFQHGRLLREDAQANVHRVVTLAKTLGTEDMLDEIYDLMAPYIPIEEKEEMRGLAHGADIPLRVIHWFHAVPEISEYGPKRRFLKQTSCSNVVTFGKSTADGELYHLRVLDWIRRMGVQRRPVILVHRPDSGNASVAFTFAGFIGCVSGMNEKQMSFGEMGYGDPPGESLEGIPFVFLFRKLMREANTLDEAYEIIQHARRTCSYIFMITDAKAEDDAKKALLFMTDRNRLKVFGENTPLTDEREGTEYPPIDDVIYGGARMEETYEGISAQYGRIDPGVLMWLARAIALKGNMQNVVFKPGTLEAWVSHAANDTRDEQGRACNQQWFYFDFGDAVGR